MLFRQKNGLQLAAAVRWLGRAVGAHGGDESAVRYQMVRRATVGARRCHRLNRRQSDQARLKSPPRTELAATEHQWELHASPVPCHYRFAWRSPSARFSPATWVSVMS